MQDLWFWRQIVSVKSKLLALPTRIFKISCFSLAFRYCIQYNLQQREKDPVGRYGDLGNQGVAYKT
jgi:hypothetical protein